MTAYEFLIQNAKTVSQEKNQYDLKNFEQQFNKISQDLSRQFLSMGVDLKLANQLAMSAFSPLKDAQKNIDMNEYDINSLLVLLKTDVCPLLVKNMLHNISIFGLNNQNTQNFLLDKQDDFDTFMTIAFPNSFVDAIAKYKLSLSVSLSNMPLKAAELTQELAEAKSAIKFYQSAIDTTYAEAKKIEKNTKKLRDVYYDVVGICSQTKADYQLHSYSIFTLTLNKNKLVEANKTSPSKKNKKQLNNVEQQIKQEQKLVQRLQEKQAVWEQKVAEAQQIVAQSDAKFDAKFAHVKKLGLEADVFVEKQQYLTKALTQLSDLAQKNKQEFSQISFLVAKLQNKNISFSI